MKEKSLKFSMQLHCLISPKIGNLIDPCIKCTNKKSSKTTAQVAILLTSQTAAILLGRNP